MNFFLPFKHKIYVLFKYSHDIYIKKPYTVGKKSTNSSKWKSWSDHNGIQLHNNLLSIKKNYWKIWEKIKQNPRVKEGKKSN